MELTLPFFFFPSLCLLLSTLSLVCLLAVSRWSALLQRWGSGIRYSPFWLRKLEDIGTLVSINLKFWTLLERGSYYCIHKAAISIEDTTRWKMKSCRVAGLGWVFCILVFFLLLDLALKELLNLILHIKCGLCSPACMCLCSPHGLPSAQHLWYAVVYRTVISWHRLKSREPYLLATSRDFCIQSLVHLHALCVYIYILENPQHMRNTYYTVNS